MNENSDMNDVSEINDMPERSNLKLHGNQNDLYEIGNTERRERGRERERPSFSSSFPSFSSTTSFPSGSSFSSCPSFSSLSLPSFLSFLVFVFSF